MFIPCVWLESIVFAWYMYLLFEAMLLLSSGALKNRSISNFMLFAGIYLISIRTTIFLKLKDYYRCHWNMTIVPAVDFHICASKSIILLCDHIYFTLWCLQIWNRHQQDESRDHHFFSFPCVSIQPIRNHLTLSHG